MTLKYQSFPGMDDVLPSTIQAWQQLEKRARIFLESEGFREIRTPILEPTELFCRAIGETSDIVGKEMYTFEDRGARSMTMRPEMTASVARSIIQNSMLRNGVGQLVYYIAPMFRAERPQAGRKRQFHQIGVELVNHAEKTVADEHAITSLYFFLKSLGVPNLKIKLNDLSLINGDQADAVRGRMRDYFSANKAALDEDSVNRLDKNVLRIFDSKNPAMQKLIEAFPWDTAVPLSDEFKKLEEKLKQRGVEVEIQRRLVRGLDYYTGVVFEAASGGLGAQDALAGGGRYDKLYGELGGGDVPCTGWSIGFERLLMALDSVESKFSDKISSKTFGFICLSQQDAAIDYFKAQARCVAWAGVSVSVEPLFLKKSVKAGKEIERALKSGLRYVVLFGDDEFQKKVWTVKDLQEKTQIEVASENLEATLRGLLAKGRTV